MVARYAKIVMCLCLAAFAGLVAFDNWPADYGSNYAFVQHVLSMDTIFPGSKLAGRAIHDPTLWRIAYALIIAAEYATCGFFLVGSYRLWRVRHGNAELFQRAKSCAIIGASLGFVLWFFGFLVVGGEWFAMWQSPTWNGQESAFRFAMVILGVLIFLAQRDEVQS